MEVLTGAGVGDGAGAGSNTGAGAAPSGCAGVFGAPSSTRSGRKSWATGKAPSLSAKAEKWAILK